VEYSAVWITALCGVQRCVDYGAVWLTTLCGLRRFVNSNAVELAELFWDSLLSTMRDVLYLELSLALWKGLELCCFALPILIVGQGYTLSGWLSLSNFRLHSPQISLSSLNCEA
jgi:hypothetical protein